MSKYESATPGNPPQQEHGSEGQTGWIPRFLLFTTTQKDPIALVRENLYGATQIATAKLIQLHRLGE